MCRRTALGLLLLFALLPCTACDSDDSNPVVPPGEHEIHAQGTGLEIIQGDGRIDLDTATVSYDPACSGCDLHNGEDPQAMVAVNGAAVYSLGVVDYASVTYEQVAAMSLGTQIPQSQFRTGLVAAYRTNEGRYGKFLVTAWNAMGITPTVTCLTWE